VGIRDDVPVTRFFNHSIGNSANANLISSIRVLLLSISSPFVFQSHSGHDSTLFREVVIISRAYAARQASSNCPHQRSTLASRSCKSSSSSWEEECRLSRRGRRVVEGVDEVNSAGELRTDSISSIKVGWREASISSILGCCRVPLSLKGSKVL